MKQKIKRFCVRILATIKFFLLGYSDYLYLTLIAGVLFFISYSLWDYPEILSKTDLIQFLIFVATLATLIQAILIKDRFSSYRKRPIVTIDYEKVTQPDSHKTTTYIPALNVGIETYYIRFRIYNSGKSTMRNAQVLIEKIEKDGHILNEFLPISLVWALTENQGDRGTVNIPQGSFKTVDLFKLLNPTQIKEVVTLLRTNNIHITANRFEKMKGNISICSVVEPNTMSDIVPAGEYRIYLSIVGENIEPRKVIFDVNYDGHWVDNTTEMLNNHIRMTLVES